MGAITVINVVTDFYAPNDGIHDATSFIQNALNAVPAGGSTTSPGAVVYYPQGTYLISKPLKRKQSGTICVGEGKDSTIIRLDAKNWTPTPSDIDSTKSFMLDLAAGAFDCGVSDIQLDGSAQSLLVSTGAANYSGIICSTNSRIERVSLFDIWGFGLWIFGANAEYTRVIDCEADEGGGNYGGSKDCVGGGARRTIIQRFHWMGTLQKNTALDMTASGSEVSLDLIDCINESPKDILYEGAMESSVRGCRLYGNQLIIGNDASYGHPTITNPLDILVEGCIFSQASLAVHFDGGDNASETPTTYKGGRVAIIGNTFIDSPKSGIEWAGEDSSTSYGGNIISANRFYDPNQTGGDAAEVIEGAFGSLGTRYGAAISVLSSYGMTIIHGNTIADDSGKMLYSMQLFRADGAAPGQTERILVQGNVCGFSPGVGNGSSGTFYLGASAPTSVNPSPILLDNTNQPQGFDGTAAAVISNGVPWPGTGGYPFRAFICVGNAGSVSSIEIGGVSTGQTAGSFYIPADQTITITWIGTAPSINVFQS